MRKLQAEYLTLENNIFNIQILIQDQQIGKRTLSNLTVCFFYAKLSGRIDGSRADCCDTAFYS